MSNSTKVDLSLLKSYKSSFDSEKQRYTYNAYNTFSGGYISHCDDKYVRRMREDLSYRYQFISEAYTKIDNWWTNYNNDLEKAENGLCNDQATANGVKESSVRSAISALPALRNFNVDSYMTNFERKKKGEELKTHYSQKAVIVEPLEIKKDEPVVVEEAPAEKPKKTLGKKIFDGINDAWCMVECTFTDTLGYLSDGLTMFKAGGTVVLGTVVSAFRVWGGDLTWKDVGYANRSAIDEAMDEIDARREQADAKKDAYMEEAVKRKNEYTFEQYIKSLPATVADVGYNLGKGAIGVGEKVRDAVEVTGDLAGGGIYALYCKSQGIDQKIIDQTLADTRAELMADVAEDTCQTFMFDDIEQSKAGEWVLDNSALSDTEREFVQGVGETAEIVALSYAASYMAAGAPAAGAGVTISPTAMGAVGAVTGAGEGFQTAYADGADYYGGLAYGTINAIIEGGAWYLGGKINMSFRAGNMGSEYMFNAIEKRILLDVSTAGLESAARTESVIVYKRKEDGSWYTPAEIWEMYDGSKALEQNCLLALFGSMLGEMSEYKQATQIRKLENAINTGDASVIAKQLQGATVSDYTNIFKNADTSDISIVLKNGEVDVASLAKMTDGDALKNVMKYADDSQKNIFVNNLSDSAAKELLKDISDDMLEDVLKHSDEDALINSFKYLDGKTAAKAIDCIDASKWKKILDVTDNNKISEILKNTDAKRTGELLENLDLDRWNEVLTKSGKVDIDLSTLTENHRNYLYYLNDNYKIDIAKFEFSDTIEAFNKYGITDPDVINGQLKMMYSDLYGNGKNGWVMDKTFTDKILKELNAGNEEYLKMFGVDWSTWNKYSDFKKEALISSKFADSGELANVVKVEYKKITDKRLVQLQMMVDSGIYKEGTTAEDILRMYNDAQLNGKNVAAKQIVIDGNDYTHLFPRFDEFYSNDGVYSITKEILSINGYADDMAKISNIDELVSYLEKNPDLRISGFTYQDATPGANNWVKYGSVGPSYGKGNFINDGFNGFYSSGSKIADLAKMYPDCLEYDAVKNVYVIKNMEKFGSEVLQGVPLKSASGAYIIEIDAPFRPGDISVPSVNNPGMYVNYGVPGGHLLGDFTDGTFKVGGVEYTINSADLNSQIEEIIRDATDGEAIITGKNGIVYRIIKVDVGTEITVY